MRSCPACTQSSLAHRQPIISSPLPNHPWEKVASDLFKLNGKTYLLVARYFSCYLEVQTLTTQLSQPQKLRKDVSFPHARKLEHMLVPPRDLHTGKGEMWHIGSHIVTLGSYILGSPRTCVTRFRTRLVWLCSAVNYFCNKAYCHAVTMSIVLCLLP